MDAAIKEKWLAALRSDKYQQAKGRLRYGRGFCCLGVLADVCEQPWQHDHKGFWLADPCNYGGRVTGMLPNEFERAVGLDHTTASLLANMNDRGELFCEIATYIENNL